MAQEVTYRKVFFFLNIVSPARFVVMVVSGEQHIKSGNEGKPSCFSEHGFFYPLGTVRPVYRTGVSLLSRERFLYI